MAVSDYMKAGYGKKQVARIITVDQKNRQIEGALKDGGQVRIAVWDAPVIFRWPAVGEVWTIRQDQGIWRLDSFVEEFTDASLTESLATDEARIAASKVRLSDSTTVVNTDTSVYVNGNVPTWDETNKKFIAGAGGGGSVNPATTSVLGVSKLSTAPVDPVNPIVVSDTDPRNTNARTPTAHTHPESDIVGLSTDLSNKEDKANKGAANGYAPLDATSKVPSANLPAISPSGAAGGDLSGTYPNPTVASGAITDAKVALANKDGTAATPSMRTLGTGAQQAAAGNDSRLSDARTPTGTAGGDLTGTYPNPTVAAGAITDAKVATANKDGLAATPSMRTLGTGAQQAAAGNDSRLSDARTPTGAASGDLTGTYPAPTVAAGAITDTKVAAANKDGTAATPSMRTLGTGAQQAAAGNDSRLSDSRPPTGAAGGDLNGTYPNPTLRNVRAHNAVTASTSNITISSAPATIGGFTPTSGDRVLLIGQTTLSQNGIWVYNGSAAALTRPTTDWATGDTKLSGELVGVGGGTLAGATYVLTATCIVGTNNAVFTSIVPTGNAGGDLAGVYPNPTIASGVITDAYVNVNNKDGLAGTPSMRTLGTGAQQAAAGNDSRLSDSRTPIGPAGGDLAGNYPTPTIGTGVVTDTNVATANKDGSAGTPSMRTIGTGALQAASGNDSRFFDARTPTGTAGGELTGSYPNPTLRAPHAHHVTTAFQTNISITAPGASIGGVSMVNGYRVLLTGQTTTTQKGIWIWHGAAVAMTRPDDWFTGDTKQSGEVVTVGGGTFANLSYVLSGDIVVDTGTPIFNALTANPIGAAGGDLTGSYPGPSVSDPALVRLAQAHSVQTAETTNINTLSAPTTLGGYSPATNERVLLLGQTTTSQNGIWVYNGSGAPLSRPDDWNTPTIHNAGEIVGVGRGTNAGKVYVSEANCTVGTSDPVFTAVSSGGGSPTGAAGGDLSGTYPNPTIAASAVTDTKVAAANKDGTAATPSMRTLGTGAQQAVAGNDSRLSDARTPTGAAGGVLTGTYPNPGLASGVVSNTNVVAATAPSDPGNGFTATGSFGVPRMIRGKLTGDGTTTTFNITHGITAGGTSNFIQMFAFDKANNTPIDLDWHATSATVIQINFPVAPVAAKVYELIFIG